MNNTDHTTRLAISELASQLRQPLRDELKISFSELAGHVELFRQSLQEIASAMKTSQNSLKVATDGLLPNIESAKKELETATKNFSDTVQYINGSFFKNLDLRITAIIDNSERIVGLLSSELSVISNDLRAVEEALESNRVNLVETSRKLNDTTVGLSKEIDNWSGLLRATSHAHSKELEALSAEVSELITNMKSRLLTEIDEQINARDNRIRQDMAENNAIIKQLFLRTVRIERFIWIAVPILVLTIIVICFLL